MCFRSAADCHMVLCNDMKFTLGSHHCRVWSEMTWPHVGFFSPPGTCYSGNGQFYQGWANITASGIPCQKWSDQVCISVRPTEWRVMLKICFSKEFPRAEQPSPSARAEQGTGFLHSWVHWCFTPSSYFNPQVPLPEARCILCHSGRLLKGFYLCLSLFLCFVWFCFANTSRKNYATTLIQLASSPKAPHLHRRTPQVFPELSDAENYCRNPGGENERPWCFTKDPSVTWEYCSVSPCGDGRQL